VRKRRIREGKGDHMVMIIRRGVRNSPRRVKVGMKGVTTMTSRAAGVTLARSAQRIPVRAVVGVVVVVGPV